MNGKIEVGDEYDVRVQVVAIDKNGGIDVNIAGCPSDYGTVFSPKDFAAHATLVKRAERPLKVGDRVRSFLWPADATPRTIVFIEGDAAILSTGDRLSGPHSITSLRRADA